MPKTTCPKCGNPKAKANAQGPNMVHCKPCGGLVDLRDEGESAYYGNDPVQNVLDKERGVHESGRKMPDRRGTLKGGL